MNTRMHPLSRVLVAVAAAAMAATFFLPVWFIFLLAPQYPEGLTMNIWLDHIDGQVDIINGLNHYIGMKHISNEMFPEFGFLGYAVGAFIALGLLVAALGRRSLLFDYLLLLGAAAGAALWDFYQWGYDYGHHLDPKAAIQVPGLYYQPPLIGHKTLLNFDAYSYPDTGGWIVVGAGLLCLAVWIYERFLRKTSGARGVVRPPAPAVRTAALVLIAATLLPACSVKPRAFALGKDVCDECRMTIMDARFGGEVITSKGRIYVFDDLHCLGRFLRADAVRSKEARVLLADQQAPGSFIPASEAWCVTGDAFKSPMNSNTACFATKDAAAAAAPGAPVSKGYRAL